MNAKDIIDYIENDAEIAMPIDELVNDDGSRMTKKAYGKVLLKYLIKELREKLNESKTRGVQSMILVTSEADKDTSIAFARWLWTHCTPPSDFFKPWKYGHPEKEYSTSELFEIFKTKPNTKIIKPKICGCGNPSVKHVCKNCSGEIIHS